jgi:hypothetical protein
METGVVAPVTHELMDDPALEIVDPPSSGPLTELLAAWSAWPKQGRLPPRSAFDPVDFPRLLPWIALLEFDRHPNRYRRYDALYRYVGSTRAELFQTTRMTGHYASSMADPIPERWFRAYDALIARCAPLVVRGRPYLVGKPFVRFEMLMLPVCRNDDVEGKEIAFNLSYVQVVPAH